MHPEQKMLLEAVGEKSVAHPLSGSGRNIAGTIFGQHQWIRRPLHWCDSAISTATTSNRNQPEKVIFFIDYKTHEWHPPQFLVVGGSIPGK